MCLSLCVWESKRLYPFLSCLSFSSPHPPPCRDDTKATCVYEWKITSGMFPQKNKKGRKKNFAHRCAGKEHFLLFQDFRLLIRERFSPCACDPPEWLIWVLAVSSVCLWAYAWVLFFFLPKDATFASPEKANVCSGKKKYFSFFFFTLTVQLWLLKGIVVFLCPLFVYFFLYLAH